MAPVPCVFPDVVFPEEAVPPQPLRSQPRVLADFSVPPYDKQALRTVADILAPASDAVLVGEHHNRPDYPPTLLADLLIDAGVRPWITLACRDRNRVVLEQEIRGLQEVGVEAVMCVTGDGRAYDVRPEVTQVFDLDGPRLAMLAAQLGMPAVVPEAPQASPSADRAQRLVAKQRCGAAAAVLNHVTSPAEVAQFMAKARDAGLTVPVIAAVAVFTDEMSAAVLRGLPGLELGEDRVASVLAAADPVAAGIDAAVQEAQALLAIDGVIGVNLSGLGSARGWEQAAHVKAAIGSRIGSSQ